MQLTAQNLRPAEEDTYFARSMNLAYTPEYHVPVGTAEVGRRAQTGDSVAVSVCVVDHDIRCVVGFYFGSQMLEHIVSGHPWLAI
jgi:hypothetical protein